MSGIGRGGTGALTGFIVVALVAAWVPMAPSRSGRARRTLAGAGFGVAGMVLLIQLLTDAALPAARGAKLPGQEDRLAMLRAGELSVPLVVSGGLLPCPSVLVLLLTAVSINRTALGMTLVVAFSLGLAGVLTLVGLLFVKSSRLVQRVPRVATWGQLLPAASALVIRSPWVRRPGLCPGSAIVQDRLMTHERRLTHVKVIHSSGAHRCALLGGVRQPGRISEQ